MNILDIVMAKSYTDETVAGGGAIAGKNCVIESIEDITNGHRVTFKWELDNGTVKRETMDVTNGVDGTNGADGADGAKGDPGPKGDKGDKGDTGAKGADGLGVPAGGTTGQVLMKKTNADNDTEWSNVSSPTKVSDLDNDAGYITKSVNNLDNYTPTSDINTALAGKVNTSSIGANSGIAELDATGKVPSSQLPSYVDDVVDGYYKEADGKFYEESTYITEITGESGKIYVSIDTDIQYRWTGSAFSALGGALVLGETSSTAYRGDRGKIAYDDSQTNKTAIGTLANLVTTAKSNLVVAINEIVNGLTSVATSGEFDDLSNRPKQNITSIDSIVSPLPSIPRKSADYSTSETTVGSWVDDSPVYQIVCIDTIPAAGSSKNLTNIGSTSVPILIYGVRQTMNGDWVTPVDRSSTLVFEVDTSGNLYIKNLTHNPDYDNGMKIIAIIQYIKPIS